MTTTATTTVSSMNSDTARPRKASVFGKMFGGFSFGDKHGEERPGSRGKDTLAASPQQGYHTSPKLSDAPRKLSATIHTIQEARRRASESSQASAGRKHSWTVWESSNPDYDSMDPPRSSSVTSTGSGHESAPQPTRKMSYVPKNASKSFLKTANGALEEREKSKQSVAEATVNHRMSVMHAPIVVTVPVTTEVQSLNSPTTRRPSGMMPNNVASRYMRSAAPTAAPVIDEEQSTSNTIANRRLSTKPRQASIANSNVKPVKMAPETFQVWQKSVFKSMVGGPYTRPGEVATERCRMQSLADVPEANRNDPNAITKPVMQPRSKSASAARASVGTVPTFNLNIQPASPQGKQAPRSAIAGSNATGAGIDTVKANTSTDASGVKTDSARQAFASPRSVSFKLDQPSAVREEDEEDEEGNASPRQTHTDPELEKLGFCGAVKA